VTAATSADADLAARLARAAGRILIEVRDSGAFQGKALGAAGDQVANQFLTRAIRAARPDDGLLSEESECDGARLSHARVWIVDPVDGTREYAEGRDDWAVHVGLAIDGAPVLGAVALPDADLVLRSDRISARPIHAGRPRIVVSRTRPPEQALRVAQRLDAHLVPMGSAGAKAMAVVRGQAELYVHAGGQHEWDSMAPVAVALAHGLHCSRLDGRPLVYNCCDTYLPDLLICAPDYAADALAALAPA